MAILIVDDSVDARLLLQSVLRSSGHHNPVMAGSMSEAFARITEGAAPGQTLDIDLVLLDIDMPDINGIEACRQIKKDARLCDVPIIMVTAAARDQVLVDAFQAGAIDYITKPFRRPELLARVRSALTLKREMDARKAREQDLVQNNLKLQRALQEIQVLRGLIKICSFCKNIQNDQGTWQRIEIYIREHSEAEFSHGMCVDCARAHYPGLLEK
ncbi:MAG TPA: response regulator [Nitrospiraceae bacterium]|nr:response regulator [Nitrospiraceae bacterium]